MGATVIVTGIEGFALYLETAGPSEAAKRLRDQVGAEVVEALKKRWSGRLLSPQTTLEQVEAALGPPNRRDGFMIGYELPTPPGYLYVFEFDPQQKNLRESGFRHIDPLSMPPVSSDVESYNRKLIEIGATKPELRASLGEPTNWYGWWPEETWEYPNGLILQLRHGVVVAD
jgi:hypothetical protein